MDANVYRAERRIHQEMLELVRKSPGQLVGLKQAAIQTLGGRVSRAMDVLSSVHSKGLEAVEARLQAIGPERVLARGYSVTMDVSCGKAVRDAQQLEPGQELLTRLHKGQVYSTVSKTEKG